MFDNSGEKIVVCAKVFFAIDEIGLIVLTILYHWNIFIYLFSAITVYIMTLFLVGVGELIRSSQSAEKNTADILNMVYRLSGDSTRTNKKKSITTDDLPAPQEVKMVCRFCGKTTSASKQFCEHCGRPWI